MGIVKGMEGDSKMKVGMKGKPGRWETWKRGRGRRTRGGKGGKMGNLEKREGEGATEKENERREGRAP